MVEYSSPNTNKPLHLGHLRNIFLGDSVVSLLKAVGHKVVKTQIINDRGIHICKSMVAWQKFGNGETPMSTNLKGDHLVGKYYVIFDKVYKQEIKELADSGISENEAKLKAPILLEAQKMLLLWENEDSKVRALWQKMNEWVYSGFDKVCIFQPHRISRLKDLRREFSFAFKDADIVHHLAGITDVARTQDEQNPEICLLYTSPSPRDRG